MKIKLAPIGAGILLLLAACNGNPEQLAKNEDNTADVYTTTDSTATGSGEQQQGNPIAIQQQAAANPDWDRKIVRTANMRLEVEDFNKYSSLLRDAVRKSGGYVATEELTRSEYNVENTVTIKVPVAQFEEAMNTLSTVTGKEKVLERRVTSQDVTTEVVDTKSRMEAKREMRQKYLELLRQSNKMDDILKVQNEINEIQEQIEMATGRVNYLNHASALSTIQLSFFQVLNPSAATPTDPSFLDKLWSAFEKGWTFIKAIILGLITIWPLLLAALGIWLLLRKKIIKPMA